MKITFIIEPIYPQPTPTIKPTKKKKNTQKIKTHYNENQNTHYNKKQKNSREKKVTTHYQKKKKFHKKKNKL